MSKYQDAVLTCPSCNKEFTSKVWQSANVTIDPYLKDEIKQGTFNLVHCSECGSFGLSSDPLLYHDMEKNLRRCPVRSCKLRLVATPRPRFG